MFSPKRKIKKRSLSKRVLSKEKIKILIRKLINLDKKYVWIPNIKRPTNPLRRPKYLAPLIPTELLKIAGKDRPYFCDGLPIKLANK